METSWGMGGCVWWGEGAETRTVALQSSGSHTAPEAPGGLVTTQTAGPCPASLI